MKKENQLIIGEATAEQIEKWKVKYGAVHGIEVDGHICYVRKIDRNTASYALSQMSFKVNKSDNNDVEINLGKQFKTGEAVLNNCWLGGSEEIRNDTSLWMNACIIAGQLIEIKEGSLKNF